MNSAKFKVGDIVVYCDGLFQVTDVFSFTSGSHFYKIGNGKLGYIVENVLRKADFRDEIRILGKSNSKIH